MTKDEAKEWLNRGWKLNEIINKKLETQYNAFNLACNATSCIGGEKVQTSQKNSVEANFVRYADISREVDSLISELYEIRREILGVIKTVPNRFYRKILYWHCFCFKDWEWIAEKTKMSKESIKKYHYIKALEMANHYI